MSKNVILMALEDDIKSIKQGIIAKIDELATSKAELQKSIDDPTTIGLSKFIDPRSDGTYLTALVATYNKATAVLDVKPDTMAKVETAPVEYKYRVKYTQDDKKKIAIMTSIHAKNDMDALTNDILDMLKENGIKKIDAIIPVDQPDSEPEKVEIKEEDAVNETKADADDGEEEVESADDLLAGTDKEPEDILADKDEAETTESTVATKPAVYKYEINYKVKGKPVIDAMVSAIPPDDPDALDTAVLEYLKPKKVTAYDEIFLLEE